MIYTYIPTEGVREVVTEVIAEKGWSCGEWTLIAPFYLYFIRGSGVFFYADTQRIPVMESTEVGLNEFLEVIRNEL